MTDDRYNDLVKEILAGLVDPKAKTTTSSTAGPSFSLEDFNRAAVTVREFVDKQAADFNDRFVKPRGFDLEKGARLIVGPLFDLGLIPTKWRDQVIRNPLLEPFGMYLMQGSETKPSDLSFNTKASALWSNLL